MDDRDEPRRDGALVTLIGVTSLTLGAAMIGAPGRVLDAAGIRPTPITRTVLRGRGVTELVQGTAVLARRHPTKALRSRVFGDVMDLGLVLAGLRDPVDRQRVAVASGAVVGIGLLDLVAVRRTAAATDRPATEGGRGSVAVLTVALPLEQVRGRTGHLDELGTVELRPAPGGRGTEIALDVSGHRSLTEDLFGRGTSRERALVALRRLKAELETGEVVRSDGAPEGPTVVRQFLQRPGRPAA